MHGQLKIKFVFTIRQELTIKNSRKNGKNNHRYPSVIASPWNRKHLPPPSPPPTRKNQNIYMSKKIVICIDHYSVFGGCEINLEKNIQQIILRHISE